MEGILLQRVKDSSKPNPYISAEYRKRRTIASRAVRMFSFRRSFWAHFIIASKFKWKIIIGILFIPIELPGEPYLFRAE